MKKIDEFISRLRRAWELSKRIRIIKNNSNGVDEVWCETGKATNREICNSFYRIA